MQQHAGQRLASPAALLTHALTCNLCALLLPADKQPGNVHSTFEAYAKQAPDRIRFCPIQVLLAAVYAPAVTPLAGTLCCLAAFCGARVHTPCMCLTCPYALQKGKTSEYGQQLIRPRSSVRESGGGGERDDALRLCHRPEATAPPLPWLNCLMRRTSTTRSCGTTTLRLRTETTRAWSCGRRTGEWGKAASLLYGPTCLICSPVA